MFDREPGPLEPLQRDVLQRFPAAPSFEGIIAGSLDGSSGTDGVLNSAALDIGGDGPPDLEGDYARTVGISEDVLAGQENGPDGQTPDALVDTTAGAEAYRASVLPHLPQPETPIEGDFTDPPKPDGLPADAGDGGSTGNRQ